MAWFRKSKDDDKKKKPAKVEKKLTPKKKSISDLKDQARPSKLFQAGPAPKPEAIKRKVESVSSVEKKAAKENPRHQFEPTFTEVAVPPRFEEKPREMPAELPHGYGDNHIYIMVRDPHWIFSYWEIHAEIQRKALQELGGSWDAVRSILRVYDITNENGGHHPYVDITLQNMVKNWYINTEPNHSYYVEIGLLHRDGRYRVLARSNRVTTPRSGMSDVIDERWMGIDFDKMYALSGGFQVGKSSLELKELMEERLKGAISSGSGAGLISSMASPVKPGEKKRGFWFILDCELIVYGATEPDARVTLQGREIKLRPDGTFSLRFALPDGNYVLDAHAFSADGIEERTIIPIVNRRTDRPAPIVKPNP